MTLKIFNKAATPGKQIMLTSLLELHTQQNILWWEWGRGVILPGISDKGIYLSHARQHACHSGDREPSPQAVPGSFPIHSWGYQETACSGLPRACLQDMATWGFPCRCATESRFLCTIRTWEQHQGALLEFPVEPDVCRSLVQDPIFCFGVHFRSLFFFCIIYFMVLIYFLVGGKLLYNVVLVSVIQHCTSAIIVHISPPAWASLASPIPPL